MTNTSPQPDHADRATYRARVSRAFANMQRFAKDVSTKRVEIEPVLEGGMPVLDEEGRVRFTIYSPSMRKCEHACEVSMPSTDLWLVWSSTTDAEKVHVNGIPRDWRGSIEATRRALT